MKHLFLAMLPHDACRSFVQRHLHLLHALHSGDDSLHILGTMAAIHPLYIIYNIRRSFFFIVMVVVVMMT